MHFLVPPSLVGFMLPPSLVGFIVRINEQLPLSIDAIDPFIGIRCPIGLWYGILSAIAACHDLWSSLLQSCGDYGIS